MKEICYAIGPHPCSSESSSLNYMTTDQFGRAFGQGCVIYYLTPKWSSNQEGQRSLFLSLVHEPDFSLLSLHWKQTCFKSDSVFISWLLNNEKLGTSFSVIITSSNVNFQLVKQGWLRERLLNVLHRGECLIVFLQGSEGGRGVGPVGQKAALAGWSEASHQRGKHAQFSFLE